MASEAEKRTRQWLNEHRTLYERCKRKLEDPEQVLEAFVELAKMFSPVLAYRQDAPAHEAVFVLASLKSNVDNFFKEVMFIAEYREKLKRLHEVEEEQAGAPQVTETDPLAWATADWPT